MITLSLSLPEDLKSLAEARAAESGHASLEDYVEALIRADTMTETEAGAPSEVTVRTREELEAKLLEGLQSPAAEMTPADWQEMRRQFLRRHSSTDTASA
jgi:hypothetical protein